MNASKRVRFFAPAAIVLMSGSGALLSGELLKMHADIWGAGRASQGVVGRLCEMSEYGQCAAGSAGAWSELKVPIVVPERGLALSRRIVSVPVAFLGLAYFTALGIWFAFIGRPRPFGRNWHRLPLNVARCGGGASVLLLGMMGAGVSPWCTACAAVHAINLVMVAAILWLCRAPGPARPDEQTLFASPEEVAPRMLTGREAVTAIAFSLAVIACLWTYYEEHISFKRFAEKLTPYKLMVTSLRRDAGFLQREYEAQARHEIPSRTGGQPADARPQVVIFTDYQCPACRCTSATARKYVSREFGGELDVVVRHFPLSQACNEAVTDDFHPGACDAAYAAEAARLQGGEEAFWRMHDLLFAQQGKLGAGVYRKIAARIGLDVERFDRDVRGEEVRQAIAADVALARELGVEGTPAMFFNGRRVPELLHTPLFWQTMAKGTNPDGDHDKAADGVTLNDAEGWLP